VSIHSSVRPFIHYQTREHDILKTNQPNLLHTNWHKWSARQVGQRSRSYDIEVRSGGLAEASFWDHFGQVGFLVVYYHRHSANEVGEVMKSVLFVCVFVCLSVSRITAQVISRFC